MTCTYAARVATFSQVLGGIFSRINWRWCFWISLILSGPAVLVLLFFVKKIPNRKRPGVSFKDVDFGGIALIAACVVCLSLALSWGGTTFPWNSAVVISLLSVGGILVPVYIIYDLYIPRYPVIPLQMFKVRNVTASTGNYFFSSVYVACSDRPLIRTSLLLLLSVPCTAYQPTSRPTTSSCAAITSWSPVWKYYHSECALRQLPKAGVSYYSSRRILILTYVSPASVQS